MKTDRRRKIDPSALPRIYQRWNAGLTHAQIGAEFGVTGSRVGQILEDWRKVGKKKKKVGGKMKLSEALALAQRDPELWFWPVALRGARVAWCVDPALNSVKQVPSPRGGVVSMVTSVSFLLGDWEVGYAEDVLAEPQT